MQALRLPLLGEAKGPGGPGRVGGSPQEVAGFLFSAFPEVRPACLPPPRQALLGVGVTRKGHGPASKRSAQELGGGGRSRSGDPLPGDPSLNSFLCFCFLFLNINPGAVWPLFLAWMSQAKPLSLQHSQGQASPNKAVLLPEPRTLLGARASHPWLALPWAQSPELQEKTGPHWCYNNNGKPG